MKSVHAVWEKRNLGVDCIEVEVEKHDDVHIIIENLEAIETEYMVIKIPVGKTDIMFALADKGYKYIESLIHLTHDFNFGSIPLDWELCATVDYRLVDDGDERQFIFSKLGHGIFDKDRIYLDPQFGPEKSGNRTKGWIMDELSRAGSSLFSLVHKDNQVGFFTAKDVAKTHSLGLGALYPEYWGRGLGKILFYKMVLEAQKSGIPILNTTVSGNNIGSLRAHYAIGFKLVDILHVYIKHGRIMSDHASI